MSRCGLPKVRSTLYWGIPNGSDNCRGGNTGFIATDEGKSRPGPFGRQGGPRSVGGGVAQSEGQVWAEGVQHFRGALKKCPVLGSALHGHSLGIQRVGAPKLQMLYPQRSLSTFRSLGSSWVDMGVSGPEQSPSNHYPKA